jgi:hypothetical protein
MCHQAWCNIYISVCVTGPRRFRKKMQCKNDQTLNEWKIHPYTGLFISPRTYRFVRRWFCVVCGPKPPLHRHNRLSFGKFQDTERFVIPCPRHFSTQLPSSGKTRKYAMMTHYTLGEFLYLLICSFLLCLSWLLHCRVRKSRRDLWITLYVCAKTAFVGWPSAESRHLQAHTTLIFTCCLVTSHDCACVYTKINNLPVNQIKELNVACS